MTYKIVFKSKVEKDLRKIDRQFIPDILKQIEKLQGNPRPSNSRKLIDSTISYRLRIGDYRVVYQVDDSSKLVEIYLVRHRKDVYKKK